MVRKFKFHDIKKTVLKNMLNSTYGAMVKDTVRNDIECVNNQFQSTKKDVAEALTKYNKSRNRFLFFPCGIWATACARINLFDIITSCSEDCVYSDTDSIKILKPKLHLYYITGTKEITW